MGRKTRGRACRRCHVVVSWGSSSREVGEDDFAAMVRHRRCKVGEGKGEVVLGVLSCKVGEDKATARLRQVSRRREAGEDRRGHREGNHDRLRTNTSANALTAFAFAIVSKRPRRCRCREVGDGDGTHAVLCEEEGRGCDVVIARRVRKRATVALPYRCRRS